MTKAGLALPAVLLAALLAITGPTAAASPATATIGSSTAVGFRISVTATKGSDSGGAPSATVYVTASEKLGGQWRLLGRQRVGRPNGFFWKVVTGPHSVRQLSIDTSSPERVTLQLLISPALGWSPAYRFHVQDGHLVGG
jgi:hypothetical protein